jgi:hypothetical protein
MCLRHLSLHRAEDMQQRLVQLDLALLVHAQLDVHR